MENNSEIKTNEKGDLSVEFTATTGQVAVTCWINYHEGERPVQFVRYRVFTTRRTAERYANRFLQGLQ